MSASHLPQGDSTSLRDMEAGGSTLESGSSGFSVSDGSQRTLRGCRGYCESPDSTRQGGNIGDGSGF